MAENMVNMIGAHEEAGAGDPPARTVLQQVLAASAQHFLDHDVDAPCHPGLVEQRANGNAAAISTIGAPEPGPDADERVHQARVAMRRLRSNLRTFRILVDPAWGTSVRAELAWYTGELGRLRDLHILRDHLADAGPMVQHADLDQITAIVAGATTAVAARLADVRSTERYGRLVDTMLVLRDAVPFAAKAGEPARTTLTPLLERTWRDARGAALRARKQPTDANLHTLRIRLKGLRYGCETVAAVEGDPARATARAAARLQTKLGDLHDATASMQWLHELADVHPALAEPAALLIVDQRALAASARKGWKASYKDVERRWRRWQG